MTRRSSHPSLVSLPPETADIDESWDDLDLIAPREPSGPPPEDHIFDRQTAIPAISPEDHARSMMQASEAPSERATPLAGQTNPQGRQPPEAAPAGTPPPELELELESIPPDSTERPALLPNPGEEPEVRRDEAGGSARRRPSSSDRTKTVPEPVVDRFRERSARGLPELAGELERRQSGEMDGFGLQIESAFEIGSALDLVDQRAAPADSVPPGSADPAPAPSPAEPGTGQDMQDRYAVGDFTGALVVAESLLESDPENEEALRYAQSCREVLTQMYAARLGALDQTVSVSVPSEQITWLSLDHRAGFLLSLIDGASTIEEILDISGMSRLEALRIMYTLVQQNVISVE